VTFSAARPAGVGIVGVGNIFGRYLRGMARFPELRVVGCASRTWERAQAAAKEFDVAVFQSITQLLGSREVDVVLNITPPQAHASITREALSAGKHVYVEKPITANPVEADLLIRQARSAGLLLGSAPDTFLGSAGQTARRAIDKGLIGEPIGVAAFITSGKVETWHPDPTYLFQPGGGPALDMGPYYLTWMVNCLGAIRSVSGKSRIGSPDLAVTSPDRRVDSIKVTTPTHVSSVLEFESGVVGTFLASFDVWDHHLPRIEIYGSDATMSLPDPNTFDGDVAVKERAGDDWRVLPPEIPPFAQPGSMEQYLRGPGVADLVGALNGAPHRASADLASHVLEAIGSIERSSRTNTVITLASRAERPPPVM